jgi:hypothetical protein
VHVTLIHHLQMQRGQRGGYSGLDTVVSIHWGTLGGSA